MLHRRRAASEVSGVKCITTKRQATGTAAGPNISQLLRDLHSDILLHVFRFIPLHPRLQVVALVCRRWCDLVRRTITSFNAVCSPNAVKALPLLPNVSHLRIDARKRTTYIPRRLQSLSIPFCEDAVYDQQPLDVPSPLLSLSLPMDPELGYLAPLLLAHASSLTELHLEPPYCLYACSSLEGASIVDIFTTVQLPRLVCLTVGPHVWEGHLASLCSLLERHATQLSHLAAQFKHKGSLQLDRLTRLVCDTNFAVYCWDSATRLSSLEIVASNCENFLLPISMMSALVGLRFICWDEADSWVGLLRHATRLQSLMQSPSRSGLHFFHEADIMEAHTGLTALQLLSKSPLEQRIDVNIFPRLRYLKIGLFDSVQLCLPALEVLEIPVLTADREKALQTIYSAVTHCPRLRALHLHAELERPFGLFMSFLEGRGVEILSMKVHDSQKEEFEHEASKHKWLRCISTDDFERALRRGRFPHLAI